MLIREALKTVLVGKIDTNIWPFFWLKVRFFHAESPNYIYNYEIAWGGCVGSQVWDFFPNKTFFWTASLIISNKFGLYFINRNRSAAASLKGSHHKSPKLFAGHWTGTTRQTRPMWTHQSSPLFLPHTQSCSSQGSHHRHTPRSPS